MARQLALLCVAAPLLFAAASARVGDVGAAADAELVQARAEARAAEAEMKRLEQAASRARGEAERLAVERQAAAAAIAASEAEISEADARLKRAETLVALQRQRLARQQAPVAALVAGIVTMGRRPPLLSIADSTSLDEFVRVRALLDTTLPVIRTRSAALAGELERGQRLRQSAALARNRLAAARSVLRTRQQRFAQLESSAIGEASRLGAGALGASDILISSRESESRLMSRSERRRLELRLAADLGSIAPAPARPVRAANNPPPIAYALPVAAPVSDGFGSIGDTGIRSRGLTLDARAGQDVIMPAEGEIAFAGPFRRHDGVVIIDHGQGWMTMMTGVRTPLRKGQRLRRGDPLGHALGEVTVELSTNGVPVSAALIAGSSHLLSIKGKTG